MLHFGRGIRRLGLVVALLTLVDAGPSIALQHAGRDFVLGFLPNLAETGLALPEVQLSSEQGAQVTVEYPLASPTFSRTVYVPPQTLLTVALPTEAAQDWVAAAVVSNAVRVFTADPQPARFSVALVNRSPMVSDASTILPTSELGADYLPLWPENLTTKPGSHFLVVATENGTTVTITPADDLFGGYPAGVPFNVLLQKGEGFRGAGDFLAVPIELTGTEIVATHPVFVVAGDICSNIPPGREACDSVFEMAMPVSEWGTVVPVPPLPERPDGAVYRVIAANPATDLFLDGVLVATLGRGEFYDTAELPGPHVFAAMSPINVVQMLSGGESIPIELGDPAMATLRPLEHYGRRHRVATSNFGQFSKHWLNIVAKNSDLGVLTVDGSPLPAAAFVPIPLTSYSAAAVEVLGGVHVTESRAPHHVSVIAMNTWDSTLHTTINHANDHFLCYPDVSRRQRVNRDVTLSGPFASDIYLVQRTRKLCAPVDKNREGIVDPTIHFREYTLRGPGMRASGIRVANQFGELTLNLRGGRHLLVPALKTHLPEPPPPAPDPSAHEVDHFRCYTARTAPGSPRFQGGEPVLVTDQFRSEHVVTMRRPRRLCVPVDKNDEGLVRTVDALLCYGIESTAFNGAEVTLTDQFGSTTATVYRPNELCVPTRIVAGCCEPSPTRCRIGGADAGPCGTPDLAAACTAAGGTCTSFDCASQCGNGVIDTWCCEECDDGTQLEGDGCSARCKVQPCCIEQPLRCLNDVAVPCETSLDCEQAGVGGVCVGYSCEAQCGNGVIEPWCCEECDDGNNQDGDECLSDCKVGEDMCVPMPTRCDANRHIECLMDSHCPEGDSCVSLHCPFLCGNGEIEPWCCEQCDNGTNLDGDGCSATCEMQPCCIPQPSRCQNDLTIPCDDPDDCSAVGGSCMLVKCSGECGDGEIDNFCCELCDDGHTCYGDGEADSF